MTDKDLVLSLKPIAVCWCNPDDGSFKVFDCLNNQTQEAGRTWIALSSSWNTESMAWFDAAEDLRKKGLVTT